jgi:uncharacterized protein (DUF1330 family)
MGLGAPPFEDSMLETYELEVLPDINRIVPVLQRPPEPFVMANLLVFKDMATGEGFEGLTGTEAYQIYLDAISELQGQLGSRLIWSGSVRNQVVGSSEPVFDDIALLEYASPVAFLQAALAIGGLEGAAAARSAGLLGQWLVASTSLEEPEPFPPSSARRGGGGLGGPIGPCREGLELPSKRRGNVSGLSLEQICRLLEGPANEPVFIVELLRFADESGELYQPYREALAAAAEDKGGQLVWRGSLDTYVLGIVSPSFDELAVTRYPSPRAYLRVLADPQVLAASQSRADGLELHWIYTADETTGEFGF